MQGWRARISYLLPLGNLSTLRLRSNCDASPYANVMKLQLLTLNVQGFNGNEAPYVLRNYLAPQFSSLDIICFQEYKLCGQKTPQPQPTALAWGGLSGT